MNQIFLVNAVWVDGNLYNDFTEDYRGVNWLSEQDKGVQVKFDSTLTTFVPWSNIKIAFYQ